MSIKVKDIPKLKDSEMNRLKRVRNFLKENVGSAYTKNEVAEETGILCAGEMLSWRYRNELEKLRIEREEIMKVDKDKYCGSVEYYYYKPKLPKPKKKWWEFWK